MFDHGLSARGLRVLLTTLAGTTALIALATDIYLPALPNLTTSMHVTDGAAQLTLTATFVGMMAGQLIFGPLSDSFGRRRLLLIVTVATLVTAVACAVAPTISFLTVARLLLGIAGGAGIAVGRAIASDIAKGPEAARVFSL
ncbi:MAG: MFS transporter, partial [bacterium]|nr:MFS transporter [bacterium]